MLESKFDTAKAGQYVDAILREPNGDQEQAVVELFRSRAGLPEQSVILFREGNVVQAREKLCEHLRKVMSPGAVDRDSVREALQVKLSGMPRQVASEQVLTHSPAAPVRQDQPSVSAISSTEPVRLFHAAIDNEGEHPVIRGVIDPTTLRNVQIDSYQREILPSKKKRKKMLHGFRTGSKFPELELAMRGNRFRAEAENTRGRIVTLLQTVWVVDGLQRKSTAEEFMEQDGGTPKLGAAVSLNSTREREIELFKILNADRTPVSANILLRNQREAVAGVQELYALSQQSDFVLGNRVCWKQNKSKDDIAHAASYMKNVCWLHARFVAPRTKNSEQVGETVGELYHSIGSDALCHNTRSLYELIDTVWGLQTVDPKQRPTQTQTAFQATLAKLLAGDEQFWQEKALRVDRSIIQRLRSYPLDDPFVQKAASSGSKPDPELLAHMREYLGL